MARTFPTAGQSPVDVYNTQLRPGAYIEHVVTLTGAERHGMEVVATPTMTIAADNYVALNVTTTLAGTLGTWASSIYAKITQTVAAIDGYICAAEFEVSKTGSYTNRQYGIIVLNNANSMSGSQSSSAFIVCHEYGSNVLNALVKFADNASYSATASTAVVVSAAADGAATHKVRCIVNISGVATPFWLLATTTVPG